MQGSVSPANRLPNPVSRFGDHANGEVFDLPASPAGGADQITGTLTFGVGTAENNQLGNAKVVRLDGRGRFTTLLDGAVYPDSYVDSGTETYLLDDDKLPRCAGMTWAYCAEPERTLDAAVVGADGTAVPTSFKVGDYRGALDRHVGAWDGFAEAVSESKTFVWGRQPSSDGASSWPRTARPSPASTGRSAHSTRYDDRVATTVRCVPP